MKRIAFLVAYDLVCIGPRLFFSIAQQKGVDSFIVIFKGEKFYAPRWNPSSRKGNNYQTWFNGVLRGCLGDINPPTEREIQLLLDMLVKKQPDLICLSTRSFGYDLFRSVVPRVREALPGVPIVSGGWGPSQEIEKFLDISDFVAFGEGEQPMAEICDALNNGGDLRNVSNLFYKQDGKLVQNPIAPPMSIEEMNAAPPPSFDEQEKYLIDDNRVKTGDEIISGELYDCFSSRGCPMTCSYCMSSKYTDMYAKVGHKCSKFRTKDVDVVIDELREAKAAGAKFIRMKDEVFPFRPSWLNDFLEKYKREIDLPFFAYVRPEFHPVEMLKKMVDAGLAQSCVGIQSASERILREVYDRRLKPEVAITFAEFLKSHGVKYFYHFLTDNPFETEEDLKANLEFAWQLPYAPTMVYRVRAFPGSPLHDMIQSDRPRPLDGKLYDWYAILCCMATQGPRYRRMSKYIYRKGLFRNALPALQAMMLPTFLQEQAQKHWQKLKTPGASK